MKEKLYGTLGFAGHIIWFLLCMAIYVAPIVAIGANFLVDLILIAAMQLFPAISVVFWIWGLIRTIMGPQDLLAIIYYVLFAIMFIPYYIAVVADLVGMLRKK